MFSQNQIAHRTGRTRGKAVHFRQTSIYATDNSYNFKTRFKTLHQQHRDQHRAVGDSCHDRRV